MFGHHLYISEFINQLILQLHTHLISTLPIFTDMLKGSVVEYIPEQRLLIFTSYQHLPRLYGITSDHHFNSI